MECEICGKSASKRAVVEDALLSVCNVCLKFGTEFREEIKPAKSVYPIEELTIDPSFPILIKGKREALNLSREQLAERIKEKVAVMERIEHGMRPRSDLAKKLERALKIKLLGFSAKEEKIVQAKEPRITLGDVVEVRIRKKGNI